METKDICGWCGSSECDWELYAGELRETAARLMRSFARKRRGNHTVRAILSRKYIYMKTGGMSGSVPERVKRGLLANWPDTYKGLLTNGTRRQEHRG
ncbi:hypothetical protein DVH05_022839 [Phytophthora capsici]|nr:hypothetical protein DVH05_022839 [Phytophthora capsici]